MKKGIYIIVVALLFASCGKEKTEFQSISEFETHINNVENGFIIAEETPDILFEARLVPVVEGAENPQNTIHIRISRKDGKSVLESGGVGQDEVLFREGYLSFEVLKDVFLESSNGVTPAVFHHYERNYGLKPSIDMFFQFPEFTPESDVSLNYRDELFGQGLVRLKFSKERFKKCYVEKA